MAGEAAERRRSRDAEWRAERVWLLAPGLVLAGGALTVVIAATPGLGFAFHSPGLQAAIETASALVAILAAYLLVGRFELGGRMSDLALLLAATTLAITNLAFSTVPAVVGSETSSFVVWSTVAGRALAAAAFAAAALLPDVRVARPRRAGTIALLCTGAAVVAIGALAAVVPGHLPHPFGPNSAHSDTIDVTAPAGFLGVQALTLVLYAVAALGFTRRARRTDDQLVAWFAAGTALSAVSRLTSLLFPSVENGWVQVADLMRLGFYLLILVGALREIRAYQRRVALAAVLDERRRLARDLHDGLAQELTFISMETRRLARRDSIETEMLREAAERALDESRAAISALSRRSDEPLATAVAQVAQTLTARAGARLRLDLDRSVDLNGEARESLLRIVREAVTNGVRHGGASEVSVVLRYDGGLRLTVSDNGRGFEAAHPPGRLDSFGLTSMRERATALGGRLEVRSGEGRGTEVEVVLP
jgi:signal transduction histidine kinase